jgi:methylthioribulose-1-phosphate dehydratase
MITIEEQKAEIATTIRNYNSKGWSPATSTNYSFKFENSDIYVSKSGIDKSLFLADDFMTVDENGKGTGDFLTSKPSAETLIHCVIYELFPETKVILHSHSIYPILISQTHENSVEFEGYEIQKGFAGQTTHDAKIEIPIFNNTQVMIEFSNILKENKNRITNHTFIMKKHGTYAWGKDLFEAKRHLETLEYLCQCKYMSKVD